LIRMCSSSGCRRRSRSATSLAAARVENPTLHSTTVPPRTWAKPSIHSNVCSRSDGSVHHPAGSPPPGWVREVGRAGGTRRSARRALTVALRLAVGDPGRGARDARV
jgi:hypothetical protein